MKRTASAHWKGDLKAGKGEITTQSNTLNNTQYSFKDRFADGVGTNPEELVGAAHAGCFTMALSAQLGNAGLTPDKLQTTATVTFDKLEAGWTITNIVLDVQGRVPKADQAAWDQATQAAKTGCPISRLLNTTITMNAKLEA